VVLKGKGRGGNYRQFTISENREGGNLREGGKGEGKKGSYRSSQGVDFYFKGVDRGGGKRTRQKK